MSLRTDLGRVRGLGSAKAGVHHWWHQRLSAVAILPLSLWFVVGVLGHFGDDYQQVVAWIRSPFVTVMLIALIAAVFYHAKLGLQVVIEDYFHHDFAKIALLALMKLGMVFGALLGIVAVLKISLGSA